MSANRERPHVVVLPEDDADRQIANGFHIEIGSLRTMRVLPPARGWRKAVSRFKEYHAAQMEACTNRFLILLIDFDGREDRFLEVRREIPAGLADRVFIVGTWTEPERLRTDLGAAYEAIGRKLAKDCREDTDATWNHPLLRHNAAELARLRERVRPILFQPPAAAFA